MRHSAPVLILIVGFIGAPGAAPAGVVRHDIPEAAFLARESDYPAVFALRRNELGHRRCIATLIDPQWAVTAAHCIGADIPAATSAGAPGHKVEIAGREAVIAQVISHPRAAGSRADVALLRLRTPVTDVKPIPIYRGSDEVDRVVALPGWGSTGDGVKGEIKEDGLFRVVENRVDRVENNRLYWAFDDPRTSSRALTLEGVSGGGDSGGPALMRAEEAWSIIGVGSGQRDRGKRPGQYGVEEVFVRVSDFAAWIDSHIAAARGGRAARR